MSSALAVNKQNQTLTVSVDAVHLAPNHTYDVLLLTNSAAQWTSAIKLNSLKSDNHGEATAMTVISNISNIPNHSWNLGISSDVSTNLIASGKVHLLT